MTITNFSVENHRELVQRIDEISNKFTLIKHMSILPEAHIKPRMEVPSSMSFAVKDHICFGLSSPEQNCGMGLLSTPYTTRDMTENRIDRIFTHLREKIPLPPRKDRLISYDDLINIFSNGAKWAIDKYNLNPSNLKSMSDNGSLNTTDDIDYLMTTIPDEVKDAALNWYGHVGDGNHFLELQYVDEIVDKSTCSKMGIEPGNIMVMYHSGSGYVGSLLGRFYAHRKKNDFESHVKLFFKKMNFHLTHSDSLLTFYDRIKYYLAFNYFIFLPVSSFEAQRSLLTINSSANFAYANRMFIFKTVSDAFNKVMGKENIEMSIFRDQPHNVMSNENIKGEDFWVHRHNSCRILPPSLFKNSTIYPTIEGQPFFIAGTNTTSSYICISDEGCKDSLNSVDHGAGKLAGNFIANGKSSLIKGAHTKVYTYKSPSPDARNHYTDEAISAMIEKLHKNRIAMPIARLKPMAALKGR